MSLEENKKIAGRYFEDAPYHPDACDEIFAPVIHFHALHHATINSDSTSTPAQEKKVNAWLGKVWGEWRIEVDEVIAEGDRVMLRWTFNGTQQSEYLDFPPPAGRSATPASISSASRTAKLPKCGICMTGCGCGSSWAPSPKQGSLLPTHERPGVW